MIRASGVEPSKLAALPELPLVVIKALSEKPSLPSDLAMQRAEAVITDELRYQIERCLAVISNEEYEKWNRVGMILHNIFKAHNEGLGLWMEWASSSNKSKEEEHIKKWSTYDHAKSNAIGIMALKKMASEENINEN